VVVKTFSVLDGQPVAAGLPYSLVPASAAMDVWAFGSLLFQLCSNHHLLAVNLKDDLIDDDYFCRAADWTDEKQAARKDLQIPQRTCSRRRLRPDFEHPPFESDRSLAHAADHSAPVLHREGRRIFFCFVAGIG
jgi:hypothetical protein